MPDNCVASFYRRNLPHIQKDYRPHFVTFVTKYRFILPDWNRQIVLNCCLYFHGKKYTLHVVVVMPDHVHLILTPLADREHNEIHPFDHVIRSSESLDAKIAYILANPVRQRLASVPEDYRWVWRKPIENLAALARAVQP